MAGVDEGAGRFYRHSAQLPVHRLEHNRGEPASPAPRASGRTGFAGCAGASRSSFSRYRKGMMSVAPL
jgi:hypothetical protein